MLINLSACNTTTDTFELWGEPICLNDSTKKVISDDNIDYFILHNSNLKIADDYCDNLKKNK